MSTCCFWVQLHNLPRRGFSKKNILRLESKMVMGLALEDPGGMRGTFRGFARVRIEVDITKPLLEGVWVPRPGLSKLPRPGLSKLWIDFKNEKLQSFWFNCGILGHDANNRRKERSRASFNPLQWKFTADLGVAPVRAQAKVISVDDFQGNPPPIDPLATTK